MTSEVWLVSMRQTDTSVERTLQCLTRMDQLWPWSLETLGVKIGAAMHVDPGPMCLSLGATVDMHERVLYRVLYNRIAESLSCLLHT
jgi:hypothetical protein